MGGSQSALATAAKLRCQSRDRDHAAFVPPQLLGAKAVKLLARPATEQSEALAAGKVTSVELVSASIARCHSVGFALNAITHETYASALKAAEQSDARRRAGAALSAVDGLPFSIKDVFDQEGCDNTLGLAVRVGKVCPKDGLLIAILRAAGAVFVCRSNVPQCLMLPESDNNIFGKSINPWDYARTPGGSSGGEGALLASKCTSLGLGSDIGGSIRIPAAFTGLCGFKPTPERLTLHGSPAPRPTSLDGQIGVRPVAGPMARTTGDLAMLLEVLLSPAQHSGVPGSAAGDPTIPRQPWSAERVRSVAQSRRPLRVAVWGAEVAGEFDGFFRPAPACTRAVGEAAAALRAVGHEVVSWSPLSQDGIDTARAAVLFYAMLGADGSLASFKAGLEGEALHKNYSTLNILASIPDLLLRPALGLVLRYLVGWSRAGVLLTEARSRSTLAYWELCREREALKRDLIAAIQRRGFDCILCPAMGLPAFLHGQSKDLTPCCSPCFFWNLVGFPALVLPATRVKAFEQEYSAPPGQAGDVFFKEAVRATAGTEGLPVGVQLVGLPFEDEALLGAGAVLEAALDAGIQGTPEDILQQTLSRIRVSGLP